MLKWSDNEKEKKQQVLDCKRLLHFTMNLLYDNRFNGNNIETTKKVK